MACNLGEFKTKTLSRRVTEIAPDGCAVRPLLGLVGGTMAHFELAAGETPRAIRHRTVDELWFVISGRGELWRRQGARDEVVVLEPGVCVTLPKDTEFQFRALHAGSLAIVAVTMPPWPGDSEAEFVRGPWQSSWDKTQP